ncbi:phage baseplate protein [Alcaligenes sp. SDU_A2]|uniref:phage baseplate protein n=1 Tax=Alcaligenes sp. SDU_A2 TaxID=3136634 RepID=UPI00311F0603
MAFVSLLFGLTGNQTLVGSIPLDALLTEQTELSAKVSAHAVEDGSTITDHIACEPEKLTVSGVITAASIFAFGSSGRSKLMAVKDALRQIQERRVPVTIVTGSDVYVNFAMLSAKISRSPSGEQLSLECSFQKIVMVTLREGHLPPANVAQSAKGKAGQTGAKSGKVSDATATDVPPAPVT